MKILVFIKEAPDTRVPVEQSTATGRVKTDWNVPLLNADDSATVEAALKIKGAVPGTHITLIHLGPVSGERLIREGLALGCDEGVRLWDEVLEEVDVDAKARVFARTAQILSYDLILAGTKSQDTGSAQLGILLAAALEAPCITRVTSFLKIGEKTLTAAKRRSGGYEERLECSTPLVATMEGHREVGRYASFPSLLGAEQKRISCLDLSDIGLGRMTAGALSFGPPRFPRSRLKSIPAPDSSLPAFERREKLREGSMTKREAKARTGREDELVEEIFQALLRGGWLDHLSRRTP